MKSPNVILSFFQDSQKAIFQFQPVVTFGVREFGSGLTDNYLHPFTAPERAKSPSTLPAIVIST